MSNDEVTDRAKRAVAKKLGALYHPELMVGLISDTDCDELADLINTLVERHCMLVIMAIASGKHPK